MFLPDKLVESCLKTLGRQKVTGIIAGASIAGFDENEQLTADCCSLSAGDENFAAFPAMLAPAVMFIIFDDRKKISGFSNSF